MLIYWSTKERLTLKLFVSSSSGCILQDIPTEFKKGMDEVTIDVIVLIPLRHCLAARDLTALQKAGKRHQSHL